MQHVAELRSQYNWLLFFSVPKLLLLYHQLQEENPSVEAIVHEISFLCSNEQATWKNAHKLVEVSGQLVKIDGWIQSNLRGLRVEVGEGRGGRGRRR